MTGFIMLVFITILQFFCGSGIVSLCRLGMRPALLVSISLLLGVAVFSFLPFLLQLLYIPLTKQTIFISILLATVLLNIDFKRSLVQLKQMKAVTKIRIKLYDIPAITIILFFVLISVWRCFYLPPTPRDLTSGPEVIAEYTVREKTMINSVFSVNLESTNNQFKPPFITSLQIIYKYAGFPFGQIWLSTIFISFLIFLYHALVQRLHSMMAGLLIVFFIAIPEMYAYTYIALFDYSNAVYYFLSCFFLFEYFTSSRKNNLIVSGMLMAIATYIRSETLILAGLMCIAIVWWWIRSQNTKHQLAQSILVFLTPSVIIYLLSVNIYINYYLPVNYEVKSLINADLFNIAILFDRFLEMNGKLIFSQYGLVLYGYFIFMFLLVFIFDFAYGTRFNKPSGFWFFCVFVIYLGYPLMGYLLPLLDIDNSTKRGLFKMLPLMLFYMGNSGVLIQLSKQVKRWECRSDSAITSQP